MESHQETWPAIGCSNHPHVFFLFIWSPCSDVSAVQQHHRLLLCIARQDDDSRPWWRRRAYGYRCKCNDLDQPASVIAPVKNIKESFQKVFIFRVCIFYKELFNIYTYVYLYIFFTFHYILSNFWCTSTKKYKFLYYLSILIMSVSEIYIRQFHLYTNLYLWNSLVQLSEH